jgi:DNA polymerase-3 subunit epsilon
LVVDVETTGQDAARHATIELAMVPFTYGLDGQIYAVGEPFHGLRQPTDPISTEITAITGITDEMVAGRSIDPAAVGSFVAGAALVIVHNATCDRRFLERFCETFSTNGLGPFDESGGLG